MTREEAINEIKSWDFLNEKESEAVRTLIPELRESEDERIRKRAIAILKQQRDYWSYDGPMDKCPPLTQRQDLVDAVNAALSYLEKQKEQKPSYCHHEVDETGWTEEYRKAYYDGWNNCNMQHEQLKADQKPAEWSEEDVKKILFLEHLIRYQVKNGNYYCTYKDCDISKEEAIEMLKSLRPQHKQEWSEEDEYCKQQLIAFCENCMQQDANAIRCADWLKSLRPQPHWKPSEEQMHYLCEVVDEAIRKHNLSIGGYPRAKILESLYKQLQKL